MKRDARRPLHAQPLQQKAQHELLRDEEGLISLDSAHAGERSDFPNDPA
jgi:hypothetical protein